MSRGYIERHGVLDSRVVAVTSEEKGVPVGCDVEDDGACKDGNKGTQHG